MALAKNSNREPFSTNIAKECKQMLKQIGKETGLKNSQLIDIAIRKMYDSWEKGDELEIKMSFKKEKFER